MRACSSRPVVGSIEKATPATDTSTIPCTSTLTRASVSGKPFLRRYATTCGLFADCRQACTPASRSSKVAMPRCVTYWPAKLAPAMSSRCPLDRAATGNPPIAATASSICGAAASTSSPAGITNAGGTGNPAAISSCRGAALRPASSGLKLRCPTPYIGSPVLQGSTMLLRLLQRGSSAYMVV